MGWDVCVCVCVCWLSDGGGGRFGGQGFRTSCGGELSTCKEGHTQLCHLPYFKVQHKPSRVLIFPLLHEQSNCIRRRKGHC